MVTKQQKPNVVFRSRVQVEEDCKTWAAEIGHSFTPDLVVFLAKSGYIFAKPIAEHFGCPMFDIRVSRPSNESKDTIARFIPRVPKSFLAFALRSKTLTRYHDTDRRREVRTTAYFEEADLSSYSRILLVDDSIDTGFSILAAKEILQEKSSPQAEIRVAGYCVIEASKKRIQTDYWRYVDTIVVTATSRYSSEYHQFLDDYSAWHEGQGS